jgi:hypothetical protein
MPNDWSWCAQTSLDTDTKNHHAFEGSSEQPNGSLQMFLLDTCMHLALRINGFLQRPPKCKGNRGRHDIAKLLVLALDGPTNW